MNIAAKANERKATKITAPDAYGVLTEPATLKIQRLLPGPIERVWAYLTESNLRRQWLAAGEMEMKVGATFSSRGATTNSVPRPAKRPAGFPRRAHFWRARSPSSIRRASSPSPGGAAATSTFELAPAGSKVLLTVIHRRLPDRPTLLIVAPAGTCISTSSPRAPQAQEPAPFWEGWSRLKEEYDQRLPA